MNTFPAATWTAVTPGPTSTVASDRATTSSKDDHSAPPDRVSSHRTTLCSRRSHTALWFGIKDGLGRSWASIVGAVLQHEQTPLAHRAQPSPLDARHKKACR